MALIKSISGIRGTIGGDAGEGLTPLDIVKFTAAYATLMLREGAAGSCAAGKPKVVVGRDARLSGQMVRDLVCGTLVGMGVDVVDIGLASTPTTELAVEWERALGGIIITASHNPRHWNALKLLDRNGQFLNAEQGREVLEIAAGGGFQFAEVDGIGHVSCDDSYGQRHIEMVRGLELTDTEAIRKAHFRVVVDGINSVGGVIMPELLRQLGVERVKVLNGEPTGDFAHNPEPIERNLGGIMEEMARGGYDLGIVVDPDVDRLAFIQEDGRMYGEEYTLVTVADYVLENFGNPRVALKLRGCAAADGAGCAERPSAERYAMHTVSNLSSTRALRDVTERHGGCYSAAAVGEVNVVAEMKRTDAVIGGEGNGGVIFPAAHYGRDALVGVALFLSHLAHKGVKASELRKTLPAYYMAKQRIDLAPDTDVDALLLQAKQHFGAKPDVRVTDIDGVKLDFPDSWVHLRKSNTEPIIRVYSEGRTPEAANAIGKEVMDFIQRLMPAQK